MKKNFVITRNHPSYMSNYICPICGESHYWNLKNYNLSQLREEWIMDINVDPFGTLDKENMEKRQCITCGTYYYSLKIEDSEELYEELQKRNVNYYSEDKWEYDYTIEFLKNKNVKSLLEIGCGQGFFLKKVCKAIENVVGTELNEEAMEICRENKLNVKNSDLSEVEEEFDIVVSFQVLEHILEPMKLLKEMAKKVKKGGYLVLSNPNPEGILKEFEGILDIPPHHQLDFSQKSYKYIAQALNMELTVYEEEPLQFWQYQMYYQSKISKKMRSVALLNMAYEMSKASYKGHSHLAILKRNEEENVR